MNETLQPILANGATWFESGVEAAIAASIAIAIALGLHLVLFRVLKKVAAASESATDDMLVRQLARPSRYALIALALVLAARELPLLAHVWQRVAGFVMPALVGWMAIAILRALVRASEMHATIAGADDSEARRRRTRISIFSRIASFIVVFITIGLMLLSIPGVRDIGVTLMASAGLAALAVGAAAQPALKSLIAGFQMALIEPLRIGDLVVIDGHTGRVEEIRMSYVIVRTWDKRAIIVPTSRFLDQTFENWSGINEQLTGPVFLHLDPATEIAPIRAEFERFVATQEGWDGRTATALLTEAHPESIELRLAMSAATISQLFDLRCAVREHMIGWLRHEMPDALIRHRLEVETANQRARNG
ncbi:MAG: mechanosensitive ion channel family protein [Novosphingobium sp.]